MCRIAGINCDLNNSSYSLLEVINAMTDKMERGGPDDRGIYIDEVNSVALGNRRLSVIDLSENGHQPMHDDTGNIHITYNGEVYNFKEIRNDLINRGSEFISQSDTEVVLKAYREWGPQSFSRLNGMYSYAIYDRNMGSIYLVRDRCGIKPLYYSYINKNLVFASEIKSFYEIDSNWERSEDWKIYFLLFGHIPEPFTILKNVFMLPRGSYMRFNLHDRTYRITNYESTEYDEKIYDIDEAVVGVRDNVTAAVKNQLISDAPLGVFLSGGIDSSLISLISSRYLGEELRTISIIFDEMEYSEEKYQAMIVDIIKSNHFSCRVSEKNFIDNIDNIFSSMDQPTTDGINSYFTSKCAHETGLKVVLSGLGGDELFGGYPSFEKLSKIWKFRKFKDRLASIFNMFDIGYNQHLNKISFLSIPNPLSFYLLLRGLFSISSVAKILDINRSLVLDAIEKLYISPYYPGHAGEFASIIESNLYMKNQLLRDTDFMSMWQSLEVRVPFLDNKILNYINSIDNKIRFINSDPKHLLKCAFSDLLPHNIANRKKAGFTFPFQKWMKNNIDLILEMCAINQNKYAGLLVDRFRNGNLHWSRFWALVVQNKFI